MNAPTKTAIAANAKRPVVRNPRPSVTRVEILLRLLVSGDGFDTDRKDLRDVLHEHVVLDGSVTKDVDLVEAGDVENALGFAKFEGRQGCPRQVVFCSEIGNPDELEGFDPVQERDLDGVSDREVASFR